MDLWILNTNFEAVAITDTYKSLIWTDRYQQYGDFELYTSAAKEVLDIFKDDYYMQNHSSDHTMIVEGVNIKTDAEDGSFLTITGRSLESILERRIIWGLKTIRGNFQNGIEELLNDCIINPTDNARKIDNFIFEASTDPAITALTIDAQYTGDNLYDVIKNACIERGVGFKVTLNDNKQFVFKLYAGTDRSYDQTTNPYVIFSPNFENLINSNYISSKKNLKNVSLIGGEGEGSERRYSTVTDGSSGLKRREIFVDARDISSDVGDDVTLTEDEYIAKLNERGKEKLADYTTVTSFEGEAETTVIFKYGEDFFTGDIVQIANEYGHEARSRVLEVIISEDTEGISVYPTFGSVDNTETT